MEDLRGEKLRRLRSDSPVLYHEGLTTVGQ